MLDRCGVSSAWLYRSSNKRIEIPTTFPFPQNRRVSLQDVHENLVDSHLHLIYRFLLKFLAWVYSYIGGNGCVYASECIAIMPI